MSKMSLVLCKKSAQSKIFTLEDLFRERRTSLGIGKILAPQGLKKSFSKYSIQCSRRIAVCRYQEGAIIILSSGAKEKLLALPDSSCQEFFANLIFCRTALLIFAQSKTGPASLKRLVQYHHMPVAVSSLHENILESRLKGLIEEKINKRVSIHGVALEVQGRGILITGPSGIGKTSTAIQSVSDGNIWIADDLAVIQKNNRDQLIVSGHGKIRNYFHTNQTGIMNVNRIVHASHIKKKAVLAAVIDVIRTDAAGVFFRPTKKRILETWLPSVQISIPQTGYLDKKMLHQATQKLIEVL